MVNELNYPKVYPKADDIIPYSPRGKFGFSSKTISLENMRNMSIDQVIQLYRDGYTIRSENESVSLSSSPQAKTMTNQVTVSNTALLLIGIGVVGYLVLTKKI